MKDWRSFERFVAVLTNDAYGGDHSFTVIPNANVKGIISQRKRQIDVLVEHRYSSDLTKGSYSMQGTGHGLSISRT
jgi:hypothetical protein